MVAGRLPTLQGWLKSNRKSQESLGRPTANNDRSDTQGSHLGLNQPEHRKDAVLFVFVSSPRPPKAAWVFAFLKNFQYCDFGFLA